MQINPYLVFDGNCREAFECYHQVLGGAIEAMFTHENTPIADQVPADWGQRIMHARLRAGDAVLMGSDCRPDQYEKPQGITVSLQIGDVAEAERIFHALAEGGEVTMEIQQTFWAARFGMFTDRFGIPWMINCEAQG